MIPGSPAARKTTILSLALVATTILVFAQTLRFDFVSLDDPLYVTANAHIRDGITGDGVRWVSTHEHGGSWHPLTGLSHMLDCELFGLRPAGHHLTSIVLHTVNSLLLFGLLLAATGATWRSGIVALLFAIHPLHIEPVAWVSGRKDVLSTCFAFLSLWAYIGYGRRGTARRYALALVLFALALMAKPMLVTLPLVFLLLDYWPLGRFDVAGGVSERDAVPQGDEAGGVDDAGERGSAPARRSPAALVIEKLPMLALAALVSAVTYLGHRSAGTLTGGESISAGQRLANALVSYVRYLGKSVWPVGLTVHYPHPNLSGGVPWAWWQVAAAAALLLVVSLWVLRRRHDRPYALVGWLWYLVTLVPVLGLVQVGRHAMADRYTYMPLVGLFIVVAWGLSDLVVARSGARLLRASVAAGVAVVLGACALVSHRQASHWRSSRALYEHAVTVAPGSALLHNNLAIELARQDETAAAIDHYRRALALSPNFPNAHNNLANALQRLGNLDEAIVHYRRALEIEPDYSSAHNNLGFALRTQGKLDEAIVHLTRAVEIAPQSADAHNNLGLALLAAGRVPEAISHFRAAIAAAPDDPLPRQNLAFALQQQRARSGGHD